MIFSSIWRGLSFFIKNLIQIIAWFLVFFGLWIPAAYALFGLFLFLTLDFHPFKYDTFSLLYLGGGVLCIMAGIVITIRHIFTQPLKKLFSSEKNESREKHGTEDNVEEKKEASPAPKKKTTRKTYYEEDEPQDTPKSAPHSAPRPRMETRRYSKPDPELKPSWHFLPPENEPVPVYAPEERPSVYFSAVEPNTLIHEYRDRFEVFHVHQGKTKLINVEYKYETEEND